MFELLSTDSKFAYAAGDKTDQGPSWNLSNL